MSIDAIFHLTKYFYEIPTLNPAPLNGCVAPTCRVGLVSSRQDGCVGPTSRVTSQARTHQHGTLLPHKKNTRQETAP
jgi:hypothetical protein